MNLSVSSSSWCLRRAAVCDCGTPWTFLEYTTNQSPETKEDVASFINVLSEKKSVLCKCKDDYQQVFRLLSNLDLDENKFMYVIIN